MTAYNSSTLYPSATGSDIHHSSSFWSLPTVVSSPACSLQSMVTNVSSQPDKLGYEILLSYPAETLHYKMLDEWTEWYVKSLYPKLVAVENVWKMMEEMTAQLAESKVSTESSIVCMDTALNIITTVMKQQHLLLDIVEFPKAGGRVKWTLYMDGDSVVHGEAESKWEVLCADFFTQRRSMLKSTPHYLGRFVE